MLSKDNGTPTHVPVLLSAVLAGLNIRPAGFYIDGTFGRGGHSKAILRELGAEGRLLAIDRDPDAIAAADDALLADPRFELVRGEIAELGSIALDRQLQGRIDGLLFDLGVSSPQLDQAERGFSFQHDGPLDMRMDPDRGESAATWLGKVSEQGLKKVLRIYGEEKQAARIARAIVLARSAAPIETTAQLATVVAAAVPASAQRKHPATKTFQAIRIFLNEELVQLERGLQASVGLLRRGGRLAVISFHSLEDRIAKRFMRDNSRESAQYRGMPDVPPEHRPSFRLIGRARSADGSEIDANPRSRSARLRVAERL
ncbi:MAG: 16S rRNA (cytosine(1402)-N(4))-methyltransferase RsmH [Pseudomonadota bacterium]